MSFGISALRPISVSGSGRSFAGRQSLNVGSSRTHRASMGACFSQKGGWKDLGFSKAPAGIPGQKTRER